MLDGPGAQIVSQFKCIDVHAVKKALIWPPNLDS